MPADESDQQPPESERTVVQALGEVEDDQVARATENARPGSAAADEAMQDPAEHEAVPFDDEASNPSSTGPEGLAGDMGVSSARTTPHHQRSDGTLDVSPGSYDAPDVSTEDETAPEAQDDDNRSWGGPVRVGGEPRPAPIEDEKSRRGAKDPRPLT